MPIPASASRSPAVSPSPAQAAGGSVPGSCCPGPSTAVEVLPICPEETPVCEEEAPVCPAGGAAGGGEEAAASGAITL